MSKALLEGYARRKQLIAAYRAELDGDLSTQDTVIASMQEYPYTKHVVTITGRDVVREQWLRQRIYALSALCTKAEAFVAGVPDELMRSLLYWHYLRGLSWPKVRKQLRMRDVTSDCLRKRAAKFFSEDC